MLFIFKGRLNLYYFYFMESTQALDDELILETNLNLHENENEWGVLQSLNDNLSTYKLVKSEITVGLTDISILL
jgi:hypothetical protein